MSPIGKVNPSAWQRCRGSPEAARGQETTAEGTSPESEDDMCVYRDEGRRAGLGFLVLLERMTTHSVRAYITRSAVG